MPRLRKIRFVPFLLAALAVAAFVPMPAWGQGAGLLDQQQDPDDEPDRDADELERNGLRGILGPDRDIEAGNAGQGLIGADGLRGGALPDAATANRDITDRQPGDEPDRNAILRDRQLRDPDAVDETALDQNIEEDPYAALGIRAGSFLLFPEVTTDTVYTDNVFQSAVVKEGDWSVELAPSLAIRSDWSRHSLEFTTRALRSYHDRFQTEEDKTFSAGVAGQFDIRHRTNLVADANYTEYLEDRSSNDLPTGTVERPKIRNRDVSLEGNHAFNRVSLTLRGEIEEEAYGESILIDGTVENNADRDFTERRLTGRVAYEFRPDVAAFIETSVNEREFDEEVNRNGRLNSSKGYDMQGGLSFQLTGKLTGEVSAGYAIQKPDDTLLEDLDGLIVNAALEWQVTGLTTLQFDASSDIDESIDADSTGSLVTAATVSVEHRPRRHIVLGASLGYEHDEDSGAGKLDQTWQLGLTGEYFISRSVALTAGYDYEKNIEDDSADNYSVNEVRFGVRVRR